MTNQTLTMIKRRLNLAISYLDKGYYHTAAALTKNCTRHILASLSESKSTADLDQQDKLGQHDDKQSS